MYKDQSEERMRKQWRKITSSLMNQKMEKYFYLKRKKKLSKKKLNKIFHMRLKVMKN